MRQTFSPSSSIPYNKKCIFASKNFLMKEPDYSILQKHVLSHRIFESELHGIEHWKQVERNGLLLATETGADITIVRLFALFHDSKRADDGFDKEHGHRFDITQEQFDKLYHACKFHTTEPRSGDATIDTCYDADRLDLGRVGIKLDPNKMATAFGARIAQKSVDANVNPESFREWLEDNQNAFRQPQPFRHSEQP